MRIANFTVSPVAIYSEPLWTMSLSYRAFLIAWRLVELTLIATRLLFIRAPILLLWTRLPVTKSITLPGAYGTLQPILAPSEEAKLTLMGGRLVGMSSVFSFKCPEDIAKEQEFLRSDRLVYERHVKEEKEEQ